MVLDDGGMLHQDTKNKHAHPPTPSPHIHKHTYTHAHPHANAHPTWHLHAYTRIKYILDVGKFILFGSCGWPIGLMVDCHMFL